MMVKVWEEVGPMAMPPVLPVMESRMVSLASDKASSMMSIVKLAVVAKAGTATVITLATAGGVVV